MVWGCIKRAVVAQNLSFKLRDVELATKSKLAKINAEQFEEFMNHTLQEESKYRALGTAISNWIIPIASQQLLFS